MTVITIGNPAGLEADATTKKIIFAIATHKGVTVKLVNNDGANSVDWTVKAFHHPTDTTTKRLTIAQIPTNGVEEVQASATVATGAFDDVQLNDAKEFTHLVVEYTRTGGANADTFLCFALGRPSI